MQEQNFPLYLTWLFYVETSQKCRTFEPPQVQVGYSGCQLGDAQTKPPHGAGFQRKSFESDRCFQLKEQVLILISPINLFESADPFDLLPMRAPKGALTFHFRY